jgi:NifU-like protein involved in Fe-S cluster formation
MSEPLYSLDILRLATESAMFPPLEDATVTAERRAPTCGSRITVDVRLDADGRIAAYGHEVRACALGQAAATLLARHVVGRSPVELAATRDDLSRWLADADAPLPEWPDIDQLSRARSYPARHGAIRLAFEAVADAAASVTV